MIVTLAIVAVIVLIAATPILIPEKYRTVALAGEQRLTIAEPLKSFVEAVHSCETEQDQRYVDAVAALRADPAQSAQLLANTWPESPAELRPAIVMAAGAAADVAMLDFLQQVAGLPTPSGATDHSRLRLTAIDGLEALVRAGSDEAVGTLSALASDADRAVQACAIAALKFSAPEALARIAPELPASGREWLEVTRPRVEEVPPITNLRRTLRRPGRQVQAKPAPDQPGQSTVERASRRRAPVIKGGR